MNDRHLSNLRFADDVVLVAQSKADIKKMLNDFAAQAEKYGLKINFDKTKVMTWDHFGHGCGPVQVGDSYVQILGEDKSEKYFGRKLSFKNHHYTEIQNRIEL